MNKNNKFLLAGLILQIVYLPNVKADDAQDFAIRVGTGVISGIGSSPLAEISSYADMYLYSQSLRLIFGLSLYKTDTLDMPNLSVQSIGVEQNYQIGSGKVFVGLLYNKAYLSKEKSLYDPKKGESFQFGYKHPIKKYQELVISLGQQYQPVKFKGDNASIKLSDKTIYSRIAMQWYF